MKTRKLFSKKEKGQDLVEYALVISFVSVVIIAILIIFGPDIEAWSITNKSALSDAPYIYESGNPIYIPDNDFDRSSMVEYQDCLGVSAGSHLIKVGTTFEDPTQIMVRKNTPTTYEVCNYVRGTSVEVIFALYDAPR